VAAPAKTGTCTLAAPSYGGTVGEYAEFDVTLPITGKPSTVTTGTAPAILQLIVDDGDLSPFMAAADDDADEPAAKSKRAA